MATSRTRAILTVLSRGGEEKLASAVLRIFGGSSLEECVATYDAVGKAERAMLDQAIEHFAREGSAVFQLRVENALKDLEADHPANSAN